MTVGGHGVGWRGTVPEGEVSEETRRLLGGALTYSVARDTHIVLYPISGMDGAIEEGDRLLNYVWYRNVTAGPELDELTPDLRGFECPVSVHPGQLQQRFVDETRATASELLAPAAAETVLRTQQPYLRYSILPGPS